jgi:hypothetical protein
LATDRWPTASRRTPGSNVFHLKGFLARGRGHTDMAPPPQFAARLLEPQLMNVMTDDRGAVNGDPRRGDELFPSGVPTGRAEESSC